MEALVTKLTKIALQSGCADPLACERILREASHSQLPPVRELLTADIVNESAFLRELGTECGLEWIEESDIPPQSSEGDALPPRLALQFHLLPHRSAEGELTLICYDPYDFIGLRLATEAAGETPKLALTTRRAILNSLRATYGVGAETFEQILEQRGDAMESGDQREEVNVVDEEDSEASVMKFVNQIIREALTERATDIHVEPLGHDLRIRYRIDGVLHAIPVPPRIKLLQSSVVSRLKIMANLDISERRLPQDGRISLEMAGQMIDVRVATIPTVNGESISLRLLGQERFDFERLGMDIGIEQKIRGLLAMPNGIVLVTGPTGCGKSTSLYTFLSALNTKERRIVTVEDPVEHRLDGVIQIAVKAEINLTFANALRSILRGDPNVVMIGEMRDFETAEIAIRAALTGHLVFSTLHTNDAVGGITRLLDMGVESFLVGTSVRAFIAQRLVRRLCPVCKVPGEYSADFLRECGYTHDPDAIRKPKGCDACRQTGYQGRMALFEVCIVSPRVQEAIHKRSSHGELKALSISEGMVPLRQHGWSRVAAGFTSIEEVLRVSTAEMDMLDE
ncbi:MAG: GspE/PulE family protein [Candidatus Sumerlaeota bacterium]